ncbi:hypothetical protein QCA50_014199 [Cerrena zonata]|uniref:Peptidase S53 activation domain-containing protein n=1 Tax=Cerrena zonata TaxID=2478898 RepID=A0AAW0FNE6_9APHY
MMDQSRLLPSLLLVTFVAYVLPLAAGNDSLPQRRSMAIHEKRTNIPRHYARAGDADLDAVMKFRIGLKSRDVTGLEKALYDVSVPGSPNYGQHLTANEVRNYMSASSESISAVTEWLSEHEITDIDTSSTAGNWLSFSAPVSKANELFDTTFHSFVHKRTNEVTIRTLEYSISRDLAHHIEVVHPTVSFGTSPVRSSVSSIARSDVQARDETIDPSCNDTITPKCLQELYGIPTTPATQSSNQIAVPGLIDFFAQFSDLKSFLEEFRPDIPSNTTFAVETLDEGRNLQGPDKGATEANLDIQYTVGLATGVPVTFVSVGNDTTDGALGFLDVVEYLLNI